MELFSGSSGDWLQPLASIAHAQANRAAETGCQKCPGSLRENAQRNLAQGVPFGYAVTEFSARNH